MFARWVYLRTVQDWNNIANLCVVSHMSALRRRWKISYMVSRLFCARLQQRMQDCDTENMSMRMYSITMVRQHVMGETGDCGYSLNTTGMSAAQKQSFGHRHTHQLVYIQLSNTK